jgi:hypothetical protein
MKALAIAYLTLPIIVASASAQQAGVKRTVLRSIDFPAAYTTVTAVVELAPGSCSGRRTHPGIDSGFVMQGDFAQSKREVRPGIQGGRLIRDAATYPS